MPPVEGGSQGSKVLIIEDGPGTAETFSSLLREDGFQAVTAADGRDGVAHALAGAFDVILVNLHLPSRSTPRSRAISKLRARVGGTCTKRCVAFSTVTSMT